MFRNWLPRTLSRTIKPLREGRRGAGPRPSSRLKLEALEDRLAPATHIWVGPAVGVAVRRNAATAAWFFASRVWNARLTRRASCLSVLDATR